MHHISLSTTLLFTAVLVAMILCLALEEKLHAKKSVIVGIFAAGALLLAEAFGLVHREPIEWLGHTINVHQIMGT